MSDATATQSTNPWTIALEDIDLSDPTIYETDSQWPLFERLRNEAPVHYCKDSPFGPFWSVTKFDDIVAVDKNNHVFSSEPAVFIGDNPADFQLDMFIAMDAPRHGEQRKAVTGVVAPRNLATMEVLIRERVIEILDDLPIETEFDWVEKVSIELTTRMLATLFNFPFDRRSKLTYWSDMATASPEIAGDDSVSTEERQAALMECLEEFTVLWNERVNIEPDGQLDFISMLAHSPATRNMTPLEYLGNLILLIVGGNDTTRNSLSGGVMFLNENPAEYDKLRADLTLIPNMVSEIIRYQTPLLHMRRVALEDTILGGEQIKKGDKVVMWYASGNRDATKIDRPDEFLIDRTNARNHVSFGFGIHRCMGNRLAEMQLRIVWEEIMKRFSSVEVVGEPVRLKSNFVRGIVELPVKLHKR